MVNGDWGRNVKTVVAPFYTMRDAWKYSHQSSTVMFHNPFSTNNKLVYEIGLIDLSERL